MNVLNAHRFTLPDFHLSALPTGAVKDAVDTLGRKIATGEFASGETIPMEAELVDFFGVSRTVVREAIKVLSGKGMVRTARRYGTRVTHYDEWNLLDPDVISWHDSNSPLAVRIYIESTQMRCIYEPEAAALAATNGTPEQKQTILDAARMVRPDPYGKEGMLAADYTFHATILEATGNIMLKQLQQLTLAVLQFSIPTGAQAAPDAKFSWREHMAVADAIMDSDPGRARDAMKVMLDLNQVVAVRMQDRDA